MTQEHLIYKIRETHPGLDRRSQTSALAAIRLFCLQCMGGQRAEVKACTASDCPLYNFRDGHRPRVGEVPEVVALEDEEPIFEDGDDCPI